MQFGDFGAFDDMLLHSHFALEPFVTNFAYEWRIRVVQSKWLDIARLTLPNVLRTIGKVTEMPIAIRTFVLFDTQVTIDMRFVLILMEQKINLLKSSKSILNRNCLPFERNALNKIRTYIRLLLRFSYVSTHVLSK